MHIHSFLGSVNHYWCMWPQHAHILAPLSIKSGKTTFHWTAGMDFVFTWMKALMTWDCLLAYLNHNKPFHIYTAIKWDIIQSKMTNLRLSGHVSLVHSMKIYSWQQGLLSIVMVLKEFSTINLGARLHIHTDHLNLTPNKTTPDCVIFWLNYVEQLNPYLYFVPGKDNVIAETLFWLDCLNESVLSKGEPLFVLKDSKSKGMDFADNPILIECFYTHHLYQSKIQIQLTTDWYLSNKVKLMNCLNINKILWPILQSNNWWQRIYLLWCSWWWPGHVMEICFNQLHDLAHSRLIPFNAWIPRCPLHACYASGQIS